MNRRPLSVCLALTAAMVLLTGCRFSADNVAANNDPIVAVKLTRRPPATDNLVSDLAGAGVNTVFTYPPVLEKREAFIKRCHARDIDVYAIFPVLSDAAAIKKNPEFSQINARGERMTAGRKNYRFVCPNREEYRRNKDKRITAFLKTYPVDGLSLDFIRYGVEWEKIKPDEKPGLDEEYCFCPVCLQKFSRICSLPEEKPLAEKAEYILEHHQKTWTEFKCATITGLVEEIRAEAQKIRPDIKIAIHALPWTDKDYNDGARRLGGQDFEALAGTVDIFSPMCYHHMLYRDATSIHRQVRYMKQLGCTVAPCVQAGAIFRDKKTFTNATFNKAMEQALLPPSDGINLYIWRMLANKPERQQIWLHSLSAKECTP